MESWLWGEYPRELDSLSFSDEDKARMAANIETAAKLTPGVRVERKRDGAAVRPAAKRREPVTAKRIRFRHAVAAAAVVCALAVGGVAYAGGGLVSVGDLVADAFGGAPAETEVVDKVGRPIGATDSCNGVTVSADAIIGDARNYMIVYSISKDDGTAFEGIEPLENGVIPLMFEGGGATDISGVTSSHGSMRFYDADPSDNTIQMVETMTTGGEKIIGKTARAAFGSLVTVGDGARGEVIAEGEWNIRFEINYEDASVSLPADGSFELNGRNATVEMLSVSPIAISLDYVVDGSVSWQDQESGEMSEENFSTLNSFLDLGTMLVTLQDGSVIEVEDERGGSVDPEGERAFCEKGIFLPEVIDAQDVVSVNICGTEFKVA